MSDANLATAVRALIAGLLVGGLASLVGAAAFFALASSIADDLGDDAFTTSLALAVLVTGGLAFAVCSTITFWALRLEQRRGRPDQASQAAAEEN